MEYAIQTEGLTKKYKNHIVVDNISMNVKKGEVYGFVGKNGAGKTTTIRLLLGLTKPTSGTYTIFGSNTDINKAKIGSLIESPALYDGLTAEQNLIAHCKLLGVSDEKNTVKNILDFVKLGDTGNKKAKNFSLGMRQRLGIAIALIGNPELLILDEPINGLDPAGIKEVRDLILNLNHTQGITVLISSHILGELHKIATCYGIINEGKLVEELTIQDLQQKCASYLSVICSNPLKAVNVLKTKLGLQNMNISDNGILLIYDNIPDASVVTRAIFENGMNISSVNVVNRDYEQYFIDRMGGI